MATDAPQHIFGDEAVEQALNEAKAVALEAYTSNTRGVLFAPNAKRVSGAVAKAVTDKVIDVLEARVAETLDEVVKNTEVTRTRVVGVEESYDQGYLAGLSWGWSLVENAEGRPGKRQLAELLQSEIRKVEQGKATRDEGVED